MDCTDCGGRGGCDVVVAAGDQSVIFGRFWPEVDIRAFCKTCDGTPCVDKPVPLIVADMIAAARAAGA